MSVITNDNSKCDIALEALHYVIDPEIGLNVVDLGLIYQIDFDDSASRVYCRMTLTTQFCPMGESISSGVKKALNESFPNYAAEIDIVFEPHWSAKNISDEGREFLDS